MWKGPFWMAVGKNNRRHIMGRRKHTVRRHGLSCILKPKHTAASLTTTLVGKSISNQSLLASTMHSVLICFTVLCTDRYCGEKHCNNTSQKAKVVLLMLTQVNLSLGKSECIALIFKIFCIWHSQD